MAATAASATTASRAARPRGAARREALLEAVLRVVADVGVDAVTHRRVAEEAQLPLASTTYWFDSKEQLLTAALELAADRDIQRLQTVLAQAGPQPADPVGVAVSRLLVAIDDERASSFGQNLAVYTLLLEAARRPALREVAVTWTGAYIDALATMLEAAGSRQPRADAQLLMATYDGLLVEQLATGVTADLTSRLRRCTRALLGAS